MVHRRALLPGLTLVVWLTVASASAETVQVHNPDGDISIRSAMGSREAEVRVSVVGRQRRPDDVRLNRRPGLLLVECQPSDGARVNLELIVPPATELDAFSGSGSITTSGLIRSAELVTDSGGLSLNAPWSMMRLRVVCRQRPKRLVKESLRGLPLESHAKGLWVLADGFLPDFGPRTSIPAPPGLSAFAHKIFARVFPRLGTFGEIRVVASAPSILEIKDEPLPANTLIRPPKDAPGILSFLLHSGGKPLHDDRPPSRLWASSGFVSDGGTPVFVSDVRMVTLAAPLKDSHNEPVSGLRPGDFEVMEDGVPQQIASAGSEDLPFNLVLLLDMSSSTLDVRGAMMEAARKFVQMAGPRDRVAVYALADTLFQVISPLTADHNRVQELIAGLPRAGGDTPLYDAVVLSYAQEALADLPDRTALVILSDGEDLSLAIKRVSFGGSAVPFPALRSMVSRMPVLIYPVFLAAEHNTERNRRLAALAEENMQQLAEATGGRLFRAASARELDTVYPLIQRELRSVYQISYYPRNQTFDGRWRNIVARVKSSGVLLRTRKGYFAR